MIFRRTDSKNLYKFIGVAFTFVNLLILVAGAGGVYVQYTTKCTETIYYKFLWGFNGVAVVFGFLELITSIIFYCTYKSTGSIPIFGGKIDVDLDIAMMPIQEHEKDPNELAQTTGVGFMQPGEPKTKRESKVSSSAQLKMEDDAYNQANESNEIY